MRVQRNGDCGSPRAVGSTRASRSRRRVGSLSVSFLRPPLRRGCDARWRHRQPLAGPMKAAAIPSLSNRNRSSFATGRWPLPRCSRHPAPGCGPQQQPTDATWLHPAVPPEPDTCPRSSRHHSYPKSGETTQSVQVIFAGILSVLRSRLLSRIASSSACENTDRSVLLGRYCRNRPLVFSLEPRRHGACGSAK